MTLSLEIDEESEKSVWIVKDILQSEITPIFLSNDIPA